MFYLLEVGSFGTLTNELLAVCFVKWMSFLIIKYSKIKYKLMQVKINLWNVQSSLHNGCNLALINCYITLHKTIHIKHLTNHNSYFQLCKIPPGEINEVKTFSIECLIIMLLWKFHKELNDSVGATSKKKNSGIMDFVRFGGGGSGQNRCPYSQI